VSITAQIREVLSKHPLIVGEGYYAGQIICDGCHRCLGNPVEHLVKVLAQVLDPFYERPVLPEPQPVAPFDPHNSRFD
jgi:hypothetical protein